MNSATPSGIATAGRPQSRIARKPRFSLIEVLIVSALLLVMLASVVGFLRESVRLSGQALRRADFSRRATAIGAEWRHLVRRHPRQWSGGTTFAAGPATVTLKEGLLAFRAPDRSRTIAVGRDLEVRFSIERDPGFAPVAVMTLRRQTPARGGPRTEAVRIVACGAGNPDTATEAPRE